MTASSSANKPISTESLENAAKNIDTALQSDRLYSELDALLRNARHAGGTLTGMTDGDYPSLSAQGLASVPLIGPVRHVPLPMELSEQFAHVQCNCFMGLLPTIQRGWVTIDTEIYFWNYETGGDLAYYEGLAEVVLSVGLVVPKPGVFQPHIKFLLVVCTASEVVVLGVTFESEGDDQYALMHLQPNPLFSLSSDGVNMVQVKGTPEGRIFLAGANGHLYELQYQSYLSWFGKRCKLVNQSSSYFSFLVPSALRFGENDPIVQIEYDTTRQLLYTRSDNGSIYVYDLAEDGQGIGSVCSISQDTILSEAIRAANNPHGLDSSNFKPLVSICPIKKSESASLALLGVTSSGVRLYFSINAASLGGRYSSLSLAHIRMPPGFAPNGPPQRPLNVHLANLARGNVQMCMSQNDSIDVVWSISPDTFGITTSLQETTITTAIEGRVWALEEAPEPCLFEAKVAGTRTLPPTIVCQHVKPVQRTILLTSQGTFILTSLRPVDQLLHLLESSNGMDTEAIANFYKLHSEKEGCATALILTCNPVGTDHLIASSAARSFFKFGGEPTLRSGTFSSTTVGHTSNFSLLGPNNNTMLNTSHNRDPTQSLGGAIMPNEVVYSGKHAGICLYFARLLAPLWDGKLVEENQSPDKLLVSRFTCDDLAWFTEQLSGLKTFLDEYAPLSLSELPTDSPHRAGPNGGRVQAEALERNSVLQLRLLVQYSVEALELWRELCEYQFHLVAERLPMNIKEDLCRTTFRDLVVSGKQITVALINALMERYFGDSNLTDALSARLREICPNLYGAADLKTTKANELLQSAKHQTNKTEQTNMLHKSLELFKQVTVNIDLGGICNQYASVGFYEGIVELCLATAAEQDNQNLAVHLTHTGEDAGEQLLVARRHCYTCITNTLNNLLAMSQGASGIHNNTGVKVSSAAEAEKQLTTMLDFCYGSNDEVFHVFLYEWLIGNGLVNRLLAIKSSYLEPYLRRAAKQPDNLQILDIMWKYYEKEKNYSAAARILAKLADRDRDTDNFTLWDRIDYISRAILCAKACSTSLNNEGEFLHELEDKMDVAQLQLNIYSSLEQMSSNPAAQAALSDLNRLIDISTLYSDYAEKFNLAECQLAIIHCAGHHDPLLVQKLWRELLALEITSSQHLPQVSVMSSLRNKILLLGNIYQAAEKFFPTQFIVQQLEVISCRGGWDQSWVIDTMLQIPTSHSHLYSTYTSLLQMKLPCWEQLGSPYHLHIVTSLLLTSYVAHLNNVPLLERKPLLCEIQDVIDAHVVDLQASVSAGSDVTSALSRFKALQASFNKY